MEENSVRRTETSCKLVYGRGSFLPPMNRYQELWWRQAKSDHDGFLLLRHQGVAECHLLHYLQMATEKIAKAYFWRSGNPPPKIHAGFVHFLRFLGAIGQRDRLRIANLFSFTRFSD